MLKICIYIFVYEWYFIYTISDVVRDLTTYTKGFNCNDAVKWFAQVLQYNVPRGKKNRGILTVLTYKNLVPAEDLTPENIKLAQYLGWCVEMVRASILWTHTKKY